MTQKYILYVNKSYTQSDEYCAGSVQCLTRAANHADVLVQDVSSILAEGIELPLWLDGTPCLVDVASSTAYKGSQAVDFCKRMPGPVVAPREAPAPVAEAVSERDPDAKVTDADVDKIMELRKQQDEAFKSQHPLVQ